MTDESWHKNAAAHFEHGMPDGSVLLLWIAEKIAAVTKAEFNPNEAMVK